MNPRKHVISNGCVKIFCLFYKDLNGFDHRSLSLKNIGDCVMRESDFFTERVHGMIAFQEPVFEIHVLFLVIYLLIILSFTFIFNRKRGAIWQI